LRSLWVKLTVACVLFGAVVDAYHTTQVRQELLEQLRRRSVYVIKPFATNDVIDNWYAMHKLVPPARREIPFVRQLFGDSRIVLIEPSRDMDEATVARLRRYFPEAIFIVDGRQAR
jgi:hypothetical protein